VVSPTEYIGAFGFGDAGGSVWEAGGAAPDADAATAEGAADGAVPDALTELLEETCANVCAVRRANTTNERASLNMVQR